MLSAAGGWRWAGFRLERGDAAASLLSLLGIQLLPEPFKQGRRFHNALVRRQCEPLPGFNRIDGNAPPVCVNPAQTVLSPCITALSRLTECRQVDRRKCPCRVSRCPSGCRCHLDSLGYEHARHNRGRNSRGQHEGSRRRTGLVGNLSGRLIKRQFHFQIQRFAEATTGQQIVLLEIRVLAQTTNWCRT